MTLIRNGLIPIYKQTSQLLTCGCVLMVYCCASACMAAPQETPSDEVSSLLSRLVAADQADYEPIIDAILQKESSVSALVKLIRTAAPEVNQSRTEKLVAGWSQWTATDAAGIERPYQMFLPKSVADGEAPIAMVVHMHGAVSRPSFGEGLGNPQAVGYGSILWSEVAEKEGIVIVCPAGRTECAWWTDNGVSHVQAVVRDVRRMVSVPDRSIFGAGFSDGASGCYYMAMVAPGPFAGFIAMNGHPAVASSASRKQVYLPNLDNTPLIAAMTQEDSLYPSRSVLPHITAAIESGADIHVISYPKMNHQPSYFKDQTPAIVSFIKSTQREQARGVRWMTAKAKDGRVSWLEILELGEGSNDAEPGDDVNIMSTPGRVRFGIQLPPPPGNGEAKIVEVIENSAAAGAGIQVNDVIVNYNGTEIADSNGFRNALRGAKFGDSFTVSVKRAGETLELNGKFADFVPRPVYRRDDPTSFADVQFATDTVTVTTDGIKKMRIWIPGEMATRKEVTVRLNGEVKEIPVQSLSAKEFLNRFAQTADRFANRYSFLMIEN